MVHLNLIIADGNFQENVLARGARLSVPLGSIGFVQQHNFRANHRAAARVHYRAAYSSAGALRVGGSR